MKKEECAGCRHLDALAGCAAYDHCVRQTSSAPEAQKITSASHHEAMSLERRNEAARRRLLLELLSDKKLRPRSGAAPKGKKKRETQRPAVEGSRVTGGGTKPPRVQRTEHKEDPRRAVQAPPIRAASAPTCISTCVFTAVQLEISVPCRDIGAVPGETVHGACKTLKRGHKYRVLVSRDNSGRLKAHGNPIDLGT